MMGRFTDVAMFALIILYTSELFPTTVRNAAVGSSLAVSQFGSISAPYIIDYSVRRLTIYYYTVKIFSLSNLHWNLDNTKLRNQCKFVLPKNL